MSVKTADLVIGPPGAGKTTYSQRLARQGAALIPLDEYSKWETSDEGQKRFVLDRGAFIKGIKSATSSHIVIEGAHSELHEPALVERIGLKVSSIRTTILIPDSAEYDTTIRKRLKQVTDEDLVLARLALRDWILVHLPLHMLTWGKWGAVEGMLRSKGSYEPLDLIQHLRDLPPVDTSSLPAETVVDRDNVWSTIFYDRINEDGGGWA